MGTIIIDGKAVSQEIREEIKAEADKLKNDHGINSGPRIRESGWR